MKKEVECYLVQLLQLILALSHWLMQCYSHLWNHLCWVWTRPFWLPPVVPPLCLHSDPFLSADSFWKKKTNPPHNVMLWLLASISCSPPLNPEFPFNSLQKVLASLEGCKETKVIYYHCSEVFSTCCFQAEMQRKSLISDVVSYIVYCWMKKWEKYHRHHPKGTLSYRSSSNAHHVNITYQNTEAKYCKW